MTHSYGVRYLSTPAFISYSSALNVKTNAAELEQYEKLGILLPVARIVYPEEYVRQTKMWLLHAVTKLPDESQWPEIARLSDKPRLRPEDIALMPDEELIDSFDREMGGNPYLSRPSPEAFRPWRSYEITVPYGDAGHVTETRVDHRYGYWQVHHLHYLQQYPDLYANAPLIELLADQVRRRRMLPRAPGTGPLREFDGLARIFDILSFWIVVNSRERDRTFALVPAKHGVQRIDGATLEAYGARVSNHARMVCARFGIRDPDLYTFMYKLLELHRKYQDEERGKLSQELVNDLYSLAQLITAFTGVTWQKIADQLGDRYTIWVKQGFRHINPLIKERDEARELLSYEGANYAEALRKLQIPSTSRTFSIAEIDDFLDFSEREGFSILFNALGGMVSSEDEYASRFRRVAIYTNLRNVTAAFEQILRDFAARSRKPLRARSGLATIVQQVMANETGWIGLFQARRKLAGGNSPPEFFTNLNQLVADADLVQSEDTYWARAFLITCLARNLTAHYYPGEDWFYGELLGEMLRASVYAMLYTWQKARRERWV